ncbi:MAG: hypothetical protein ACLQNE_00840 [Thermoguttaceae bacterium]
MVEKRKVFKTKVLSGYSQGSQGPRRRKKRPSRRPPPLTIEQILAWVDAHHERTGQWPNSSSGRVRSESFLTWHTVDGHLRKGQRGLPGGSSLPRLLAEQRGRPLPSPLTIEQILAWADAHYERTGRWPNQKSGRVHGEPSVTWLAVNSALRMGQRGLPGGSSLPRLLVESRGVRSRCALPTLKHRQILDWADAHHKRTGKWPIAESGPVEGSMGETWKGIDHALRHGFRGIPGGTSLARLLHEYRGVPNKRDLPRLSVRQILAWADAHRQQTGEWPHCTSGPIEGSSGETWGQLDQALAHGYRGLRGGSSLAKLLAKHRKTRNRRGLPSLSVEQILKWADEHHRRTGGWPSAYSGPAKSAAGETWPAINSALRHGVRGFPGGSSLIRLLAEHRGVRNRAGLPHFSIAQILKWADAHHERTGRRPRQNSGPVQDAPGETWCGINSALRFGGRGLRGGSSLFRLLEKHRHLSKGLKARPVGSARK